MSDEPIPNPDGGAFTTGWSVEGELPASFGAQSMKMPPEPAVARMKFRAGVSYQYDYSVDRIPGFTWAEVVFGSATSEKDRTTLVVRIPSSGTITWVPTADRDDAITHIRGHRVDEETDVLVSSRELTVTLPDDLVAMVEAEAAHFDDTPSEIVRWALENYRDETGRYRAR